MNIARREFLAGTTALGSLLCGRLFAAEIDGKRGGKPKFVFGVVADTHLRTSPVNGKVLDKDWQGTYFESALRYFRERNVDAIVHCGDFAHLGQIVEMKAHADIWRRVFPANRAQDGHEVVKLFVTGNHEFCSHIGGGNGAFVRRLYPGKVQWDRAVLQVDTARKWQRIWGEEYREVWHREVKGFHFFGWQYGADLRKMAALVDESIVKWGLDRSDKPFFFIGHVPEWRPRELMEVLERHGCRNSLAFYGHNHYSSANLNTFVCTAGLFTSINVPCCAPWYGAVLLHDETVAAAAIGGREDAERPHSRQGLVVSLYDDRMVIERREFGSGGSLGPKLVMPFGKTPHPFVKNELKKVVGAPQFRKGAKLEVGYSAAKDVEEAKPLRSLCSLRLKIPLADGNSDSRVYAYEVVVVGRDDPSAPKNGGGGMGACRPTKLVKAVYAAGCNMGIGHEPDGGVTTLEIAKDELPPGESLTFAVRPLTSLGISGRPIATEFKV